MSAATRNRSRTRVTAGLFATIWLAGVAIILLAGNEVPSSSAFVGRDLLQSKDTSDESAAGFTDTAKFLHGITHKRFNGQKVESTLFLSTSNTYGEALIAIGLFPLCIGFLVGCIAPGCFCCGRYCFNTCGGKEPKEGGYSVGERRILKILMVINILFIIPVTIVAITGHVNFAPGVGPFLNRIDDAATAEADLLDTIPARLNQIDPNGTALRTFVAHLSTADGHTTRNHRDSSLSWFNKGELLRTLLLAFTWSFIFSTIVVGIMAIFMNNAKTSMCMAFLAFVCMFMVWWSFALIFPVSIGVADFCHDLQVVGIDSRMADYRAGGSPYYKGWADVLYCASRNRTRLTADYVNQLKFDRLQKMSAMTNSSSYNSTTYNQLSSEVGELDEISDDLAYVRDCGYALPALDANLNSDVCGKNLQGLVTIWAAMFVLFCLLGPLAICGILGYKRLEIEGAGYF